MRVSFAVLEQHSSSNNMSYRVEEECTGYCFLCDNFQVFLELLSSGFGSWATLLINCLTALSEILQRAPVNGRLMLHSFADNGPSGAYICELSEIWKCQSPTILVLLNTITI